METFDYLIIGAGPGGYELAAAASRMRKKTLIIERGEVGGTCLNRGCIPTKALAHAAAIISEALEASLYGINAAVESVDYKTLCQRRDEIVGQLREGVEGLLSGVEVRRGTARFSGPKEVEVDGEKFTAEKIVIATGSEPAWLPIPGAHDAISSDGLLQLTEVPESMIIIGGGVIGMEFASIFNTLGSKVTVIEYCKEILPQFDKDIAKRLRAQLAAAGITFITGAAVTSIEGRKVTYTAGEASETVAAQTVVMAVGRRPVLPEGLELAGVATERGAIIVDPTTLMTSAEGVYAIGDVNRICMLAHAASAQGRRVLGEEVDLDVIPSVVFTTPEVAMVGLSEAQCKEKGLKFKSAKALYRSNGKAVTMNATSGIVKLIYETESHKILGCSVLGSHAADMVQEVAVAMANGLTTDDIAKIIHAHPTLSEILLTAASLAK